MDKHVPELRFSEFNDDWITNKIRDIGSVKSGSTPARSEKKYFENGKMPWVKTTDLNNSDIYKTEENVTAYAISETSIRINPLETVLVAMYGGFNQIGRTGFLQVEAASNQALSVIETNRSTLLPRYLLIWLNAKVHIWRKFAASSRKDPNITGSDVKAFPVSYPHLKEQQKIADFLSSVDNKIRLLTEKQTLLQQYKKGVMQKLFPSTSPSTELRASSGHVPELRFASTSSAQVASTSESKSKVAEPVEAYPDWEEKRFGEVATFAKGKGISKSDIDFDGKTSCIRYGELYTSYNEVITTVNSKTNVDTGNLILSKAGDVLIPSSGETQIDIATASCVLLDDIAIGGDLTIVKSSLDGRFLSYYLNSHKKIDLARLSQGSSVIHLYSTHFKILKIDIPCLEEQQKIADFLSEIDKKIESVSKQIEHTQTFKRGLLQQMFV